MRTVKIILVTIALTTLTACGIQSIPQSKNGVDAALAEVTNQYKRRADLVPNLVEVVKGYAKHEEQVLVDVTEARARATRVEIDPNKMSADKLKEYMDSQGALSSALGRLMMITENYPNLKADAQFRDLQAQIEGTENRVTVARQRLIEAIKMFNDLVTVPPTSWTNSLFYKHDKMPQWDLPTAEKERVAEPPKVNF